MQTRVDQIAERVYRISTYIAEIGPTGFTFNQFLVDADETCATASLRSADA
jgi:acyl-CoA thioesterase FadM